MTFLSHLHSTLSYLSFIATLVWAGAILFGAGDVKRFGPTYRKIYLAVMILTGLAGVFGLIITVFGPWLAYIFPWLGLAGLVAHNILGARAKRALAAMATGSALKLALAQVVILIVVTGLMSAKPF